MLIDEFGRTRKEGLGKLEGRHMLPKWECFTRKTFYPHKDRPTISNIAKCNTKLMRPKIFKAVIV
jgi:hypothetical protein